VDARDFQKRADECLQRVTRWLEDFDPDELDYTSTDGVLTLTFADGKRFVLNRQSAASQMWLAAGARAWHYRWDEPRGEWLDDKDAHALIERIGSTVSEKLGRTVRP
jgi:CyaY protein